MEAGVSNAASAVTVFGALVLGAVLAVVLWTQFTTNQDEQAAASAQTSYRNSVRACRRGNPLRRVVFRNAEAAIKHSKGAGDPPEITAVFERNLEILLATPGVDPDNGRVDCRDVVDKP